MNLGISGRIALVTGGTFGVAMEVSRLLVEHGAYTFVAHQDEASLRHMAGFSESTGIWHLAAALDTDAGLDELAELMKMRIGLPDVLVHCAGVFSPRGPLGELTDVEWQPVLDATLTGTVRVGRTFIPSMAQRGWGRVVFTASEDLPASRAKTAIIDLGNGLSSAYAGRGVLVRTVSSVAFIAAAMTAN